MGGRSRRSTGPARRRDGEVFCPLFWRWRMLPPLPVLFGESPELSLCAAGPSLLVATMAEPEEIGGRRYVAALQLAPLRAKTEHELDGEFRTAAAGWERAWEAEAAAAERWVLLGALPQGDGVEGGSLVCLSRQ